MLLYLYDDDDDGDDDDDDDDDDNNNSHGYDDIGGSDRVTYIFEVSFL